LLALLPLGLWFRKRAGQPVAIGVCLLLVPIGLLVVGPDDLYASFVPLVIACALGLTLTFPQRLRPVAVVSALILTAYGGYAFYGLARGRESWTFDRRNLYRTVEQAGLSEAVVLITTPSSDMPQADLARNANDFRGDVLYARALQGHYSDLIRYYPRRAFFEYSYEGAGRPGRLSRLETTPDGRFRRSAAEGWVETSAPAPAHKPGADR